MTATAATTPAPAGPPGPAPAPTPTDAGSPLRWAIADTLTITGRTLAHWARQPGMFALNLLFPVFSLLLFGYLFAAVVSALL